MVDYNPVSKIRTIKYDGEEDHCQFDITVDYIVGDLVVIDNWSFTLTKMFVIIWHDSYI